MNIAFCDGGLSNRLNSLIFCLILKAKYGHNWAIGWPKNNWCGAAFDKLFESDLAVRDEPLDVYRKHESEYQPVLHENQCNFSLERLILQSQLAGYADYEAILNSHPNVLYCHNLLPSFVSPEDWVLGLRQLGINSKVVAIAEDFCQTHRIDNTVLGLHIRKTDFGDTVDDQGLFNLVVNNSNRFFVCSDDAEVNRRFSELPNCSVFEKQHFPQKLLADGDWKSWTTDAEGRRFPFNITRPEDSIIEALIDLLILSRTTLVSTSHSTFLNMAIIFKTAGFFRAN